MIKQMKKIFLIIALIACGYCVNAQAEKKSNTQPVKKGQSPGKAGSHKKVNAPAAIQVAPADADPASVPVKKNDQNNDPDKATKMEKPSKENPKE